jgi:hypothetical protein
MNPQRTYIQEETVGATDRLRLPLRKPAHLVPFTHQFTATGVVAAAGVNALFHAFTVTVPDAFEADR